MNAERAAQILDYIKSLHIKHPFLSIGEIITNDDIIEALAIGAQAVKKKMPTA